MKVTPVGAVSNYGVQMQQQSKYPHYCIFEQKICSYAHNVNGAFECKAPSDEEMKCR